MHLPCTNAAFYRKSTFGSNFFSPTVLFSRGKNVGIQGSLSSVEWKLQDARLTVSLYCTALNDHISSTSSCNFLTVVCARSFCFDFSSRALCFIGISATSDTTLSWGDLICFELLSLSSDGFWASHFINATDFLPNDGFKNNFVVVFWYISVKYGKS